MAEIAYCFQNILSVLVMGYRIKFSAWPISTRQTVGAVVVLLSILLIVIVWNIDSAPSVNPATDEVTESRERVEPPDSGVSCHAIDLLDLPGNLEGRLITVDVWSIPEKIPWINGEVRYHFSSFDTNYAITTQLMGLIFDGYLGNGTWLFDVTSNKAAHYPEDLQGSTNFEGNIVVEMSSPGPIPDTKRLWKLEPSGYSEGTTRSGLVIRVHKFTFWGYADEKNNDNRMPNMGGSP
jgi:hypothetical protein